MAIGAAAKLHVGAPIPVLVRLELAQKWTTRARRAAEAKLAPPHAVRSRRLRPGERHAEKEGAGPRFPLMNNRAVPQRIGSLGPIFLLVEL